MTSARHGNLRVTAALILGGVLIILHAQGCGPSQVPADKRNTADREAVPQRLISLAPSITEILFALDLGDRLVGVTEFCDYPEAAVDIPNVGGYLDPDLEGILALQPDLVIVLDGGDSSIRRLETLGIPCLAARTTTVEGILESVTAIGEACAVPERASDLRGALQNRLDAVAEAVAGLPRPKVLLSIGRTLGEGTVKDMYVAGDDGFFSELIRLAGGINACTSRTIRYPLVTQEGVMQMRPDVIIELAADLNRLPYTQADILREWHAVPGVPAVANDRICVFTEDYVTVPGPRFVLLLEKMAAALHPDAELSVGEAVP